MKNLNKTLMFSVALFLGMIGYTKSQTINVPEPEFINTAQYIENGVAQRVEKAIPFEVSKRTTASYVTGYYASEKLKQVKGISSPVRLSVRNTYTFIIRVSGNEYDPYEEIAIIKMESTRTGRKYRESSYDMLGQQKTGDINYIPFDGKKYGKSSYLIQISQPLEAGEYAIQLRRASDVLNCFGVGEVVAVQTPAANPKTKTTTGGSNLQANTDGSTMLVKGNFILDGGIGLGSALYGGTPLFVSGEYMLTDDIGLGFELAHLSYTEDYNSYYYNYTIDWKVTTFGPRITYHVMNALDIANPKLDLYGGLFLGYANVKAETSGYSYDEQSPLSYAFFIGTRYMVTDKFGFMGELGYGVATLKLGITLKLN